MVVERASRLVDTISLDIESKKAEAAKVDSQILNKAQKDWDNAEEVSRRFSIEEELQDSFQKIKSFYTEATIDKTERPTDATSKKSWNITIDLGDGFGSFGLAINNNSIRIIGEGQSSIDVDTATKELIDDALLKAYNNPFDSKIQKLDFTDSE